MVGFLYKDEVRRIPTKNPTIWVSIPRKFYPTLQNLIMVLVVLDGKILKIPLGWDFVDNVPVSTKTLTSNPTINY